MMYIRELNSQVMTQWTTTTAIDPLRMAPTAMVIASLAGGNKYGTAKKVNLFSVRVLDCRNRVPWSVVLDGLD